MATKAERLRSEDQRTNGKGQHKSRASEKKPKKAAWSHDKAHAASKATHALEDTAPGKRPSRESTRGSANRAKADAAFNVTEETKKGAPTNRARKSRANVLKVRGGGARPAK
ncbi:MAG TPA: hypothetical protein VN894_17995 [Polyangiaceae bacterium]|nr:hypothetical protein [Polyangiaceae bacterium]